MEENYFKKLSTINWEVDKKNWMNYISWANAWDMVKKEYPNSTYNKIRNDLDNSYLFKSWTGWMCEVEVTINWITHSMDLPVLDFKNQPVSYDKIDSFQINKTLMRAFTKAIAMHWIWLYVFKWEDLPDTDWEYEFKNAKTLNDLVELFKKAPKTKELIELKDTLKINLK